MALLSAPDEAALVAELRGGPASARGEEAFRRLFESLREPVFTLCWNLTRSRAEAEDAMQECFIAIHRGLPGFRGQSRLSTWVYRIAIHAALKVKARRSPETAGLEAALGERSWEPGPDERADARQRAAQVHAALEQLGEEHRTVLSLFAVQGLTHEQIAEVLGIPLGTVWSRLHTARKRVAALLT